MRTKRHPMTRRLFLSRAGAVAAAGAVSLVAPPRRGFAGLFSLSRNARLDMLTKTQFDECLGDTFRLKLETGEVLEVELIESAACGSGRSPAAHRDPFSIVFRAAKGTTLPQQIYRLEHARLGALEVFLVPLGPDDRGMRLEAVFT